MCPSGGRVGGVRDRLRRFLRGSLNREYRPVTLLLPAVLLLLLSVYCFPLLSALVLCVLAAGAHWTSGGRCWRLAEWGQRAAAGGRLRPVQHRRAREPPLRWSPASLLLLMGSYLGKQEPPARAVGRGTRDLKERLTKPNPAVPTPARRLSFRETPVVTNRTFMSPRRRYPTHQPQYSMPGSLPTVYGDGFPRKTLLSPKHSQLRSPVTVKIARPDPQIGRSPVLTSLASPSIASPSVTCAPPDPCAKETVLNAIRESRKRMNKDEEYNVGGGMDNKRRRQVSSGSGESLTGSPVINGSMPYVSRSDTLKRALNTQMVEETVNKRSRTSSNSSLSGCTMNGLTIPTHNAITSSFSSSRVLLQKRKRTCQSTSVISSPPSSRSQTPDLSAKKSRDELHEVSQSTPVKSTSGDQSGQSTETPSSKSLNSSADNGSGGPRRKKVLLVCSGRGEQYPLPPPPVVGYNITSRDLDSEKKAFLQRLNKALEETAEPPPASLAPSTATVTASPLFNLSTAAPTLTTQTLTLQASTANGNPLLQSLAKMQSKEGSQEPAQGIATTFTNKVPSSGVDSAPSQKASIQLPSQPVSTMPSNSTSQPNGAVQNKPESKSSLLQLLTQPLGNDLQSSFKPLFPSNVSANPPSVSSSAPSAPSISSTNTFKPIFGPQSVQQNPPASTFKPIFGDSAAQQPATSAPSPFTFPVNSNPTSTAPPSFSGFGATTTSTAQSTDGATKPSLSLPTSSSATINFSSAFSGTVSSSSAATSAPTSKFLGSGTSSDSQTKTTFVFGQAPTSQGTPVLNMFGNKQNAPTSQPQPSVFGSTTSAFSATINSNPPPFPASSSASTFNSGSGSVVQADKPATNQLASFGTAAGQTTFGSGTQPPFGSNTQSAFGANSQPAFGSNSTFTFGSASALPNQTPFGSLNSTQTNSTPASNQFGASKPFTFGEKNTTAVSFGATTSTLPAPAMTFGNSSVAQNSTSLSFGTPGPTEKKLSFETPVTPFGQNPSPAPINFGTPTQSFGSPNTSFGQQSGFSIGVTSKASGARQRLMARRQHTRKK